MTIPPIPVQPLQTTDYVLPAPPRGNGELVVVAPDRRLAPALRRSAEVARTFGQRGLAFGESQQLLLEELRERLAALDAAITDAPRAQLKGAVRELGVVLDWCDATQQELVLESRRAITGKEPLALALLAEDVVTALPTGRTVHVVGHGEAPFWAEAAAFAELIRAGVELVAERAPGTAAIAVTIERQASGPRVHFACAGEPSDGIDAATIRRFRSAVERLDGVVSPDALGPGTAGCVVELPE